MKDVLFVTYGSGHVRMVVPVAKALAASGAARPRILALTTAAKVVLESGLELLQFKDFIEPGDEVALAHGRRLMAEMPGQIADRDETVAYLGLCYAELEADIGPEKALKMYKRDGRQAFLPVRILERIVRRVAPALVVATNSPRAERAAIMAAGALGLPSVCLVDLFCIDEVKWIGAPDYAQCVCVLNESVKRLLLSAGRTDAQVVVTGNPALDALCDPGNEVRGNQMRRDRGWKDKRVVLWPAQTEPRFHPFNGRPGDPMLPATALGEVLDWVRSRTDTVLCVRPRAGDLAPKLPADARIVVTGQEVNLCDLLFAVDLVVTLNSTVGLEGHLAGARLVQVLGSVFDQAMPLLAFGVADSAVKVGEIGPALSRWIHLPRKPPNTQGLAVSRVLSVVRTFL